MSNANTLAGMDWLDLVRTPTPELLELIGAAERHLQDRYDSLFHRIEEVWCPMPTRRVEMDPNKGANHKHSVEDVPMEEARDDDVLVESLHLAHDVLAQRLGVKDRLDSHEDDLDNLERELNGQQRAIDWLKEHEHSEYDGLPLRQF